MRKKQSKKRDLIPDPKFNDQLVTRFVNNLMQQGKKSTAYKIFYDAIDIIESNCGVKPPNQQLIHIENDPNFIFSEGQKVKNILGINILRHLICYYKGSPFSKSLMYKLATM